MVILLVTILLCLIIYVLIGHYLFFTNESLFVDKYDWRFYWTLVLSWPGFVFPVLFYTIYKKFKK